MVAWSWGLALVCFVGVAVGQPLLGAGLATDGEAAPAAAGPSPSPDPAAILDALLHPGQGVEPAPGVAGLALLAQQPPQPPGGTNATNATTIPGFGNGTNTHHHGNVGNQGLGAVWASVFHGVPEQAIAADLDADGALDAVVGTDLGVTAVNGRTGAMMWARHIGSTVTSLFAYGEQGAVPRVGYSTLWEGQTARVGSLEGRTGTVLWEHIGLAHVLVAAAAEPGKSASDVLAVDVRGVHTRLAGATGEPVWEADVDLLADDVTDGLAPGLLYSNDGTYLAKAGDLTGDGIADTISVQSMSYGVLQQFSYIVAVDGATGQRLWITNVGGDPHNISTGIVYDIEPLDAQGDGSLDLAYSFLVLRYELILAPVFHWEQGWRVTKGDSPNVGVPIASRTLVTPVLPVETFPDLDHTDVDGDGRHELAVLRNFLANGVLTPDLVTYERYALPVGSTSDPTQLAVSDVAQGAGAAGRIAAFDLDGDGALEHGIAREADGLSTWAVVMDDGQVLGPFDTGAIPVRAAAGLGERVAVATRGALQLRPAGDLAAIASAVPLRGAPRSLQMADADGDGTPDAYILASDGAIHVVDGVTGVAGRSYDVGQVLGFTIADLREGPEPDLILLRHTPNGASHLEARSGADNGVLYGDVDDSVSFADPPTEDPVWFDGDADGVPDALTDFEFAGNIGARRGRDGDVLWNVAPGVGDAILTRLSFAVPAHLDAAPGDDLMVAAPQGILLLDGVKGRTLGWHQFGNSTIQPTVRCLGAADGDGDGIQSVFAIHAGSAGDVARRLDGAAWTTLDWVADEAQVVRCDLVAVPTPDGREDLLVTMVWTQGGDVQARVGRHDVRAATWTWQDVRARPDVEAEAYAPLGVVPDAVGGGRLWLAWQDHAYALDWRNGTAIGEFTVNGPFVQAGVATDLDGQAPSEAIVLAADGILWALAEDRGAVASRLAQKAIDEGKPNNYGAGSSFEAPPPPPSKKKDKGFLPGPSPVLLGAVLVLGVALMRLRRGNR